MRLSAHLQGLEVQAWAKSGLGEKPYLLDRQDIENFVPPLLVVATGVNKQHFVND